MKVDKQIDFIKKLVAEGALKDAITKLQQLMAGSNRLNEIIIQSAKLSDLQAKIMAGIISFDDQNVARNNIVEAVLDIVSSIQETIHDHQDLLQNELNYTLDEIIRKHGIDRNIREIISAHRQVSKIYRCLWIDDQASNDQMEMQALAGIGLECRTAKNPYEAYAILRKETPDIIIVNSLSRLKDNENEGIEFCHYLFQQEVFKAIPIIFHSISFQDKLQDDPNREKTIAALPKNIKNRFEAKNSLVIRDLIEEVVYNVFQHNNQ